MARVGETSRFDYLLFVAMIASCVIGLSILVSYMWRTVVAGSYLFIWKQMIAFSIGLTGALLLAYVDYRHLKKYAPIIYVVFMTLLFLVLIFGKVARGARSWFSIGPFSFQPSEFMALAYIIFLAWYIELQQKWEGIKQFAVSGLITLLPMGLILLQPDFGTSLVFIAIFLGMVYLGGAQLGYILSLVIAGAIASFISLFLTFAQLKYTVPGSHRLGNAIAATFSSNNNIITFLFVVFLVLVLCYFAIRKFYRNFSFANVVYAFVPILLGVMGATGIQGFLKGYQRQRLIAFLEPTLDPLGVGYNIIQSKIAIGSGKFLGKGILSGTQSQLGFLPEQHTDFIFAVIGEELGFVGAGLVLFLLCLIIWRGIVISTQARDTFGGLLAAGIVCMFAFHAVINIGMVMGIMPVVGVPLPLISYGGSSLIAHMLAIGVLLSVSYRRYMY
ncbi:MAG: rod shape-determining protein RodA [bacterium]